MRLLVITPMPYRGGTEEYALTIAGGARERGWEVHAAFPNADQTASLATDFARIGVTYHPLDISAEGNRVIREIRNERLTRRALDEVRPTVVLLNLPWPLASVGSVVACGRSGVPTAVVFHLASESFHVNPLLKTAMRWARRQNQRWLGVSGFTSRAVSTAFGLPTEAVATVYNGTSVSVDPSPERRWSMRDRIINDLSLPPDAPILLSVGALAPQKGYDSLIAAIPRILSEHRDAHFVWVGVGPMRETLEEMLASEGISTRVSMLGRRSDVLDLMLGSDVLVFPTLLEGLPFVLLEAMAAELPVVASDVAGIPEVVQHMRHGVLCKGGEPQSIAEAVLWALAHPHEMRRMAQAARERCSFFSQHKMVEGVLAQIQSVADE